MLKPCPGRRLSRTDYTTVSLPSGEEPLVPTEESIRLSMHELAANFPTRIDLDVTLGSVTAAAVTLMDEVDYADVMLIRDGQARSVKPTVPVLSQLDAVQIQLQQGPCLAAAVADSVVRCPDLSRDSRWPEFGAVAVEVGIRSMLSFQLYAHDNGSTGALNLFSQRTVSFDLETETIGAMLATHAAVAIMATNEHDQFQSALASRDTIGQAKGILMERFQIDAVKAFVMLTRLSQQSNIPVRTIAVRVVESLKSTQS
jgi:GAF domain-containing protein